MIERQVRYVPALEDIVIGIIVERHAESYKGFLFCFASFIERYQYDRTYINQTLSVDIGAAANAILSSLAFDGVTKKNKLDLLLALCCPY